MGRASDIFKMTEENYRFVLLREREESKMLRECARKKEKRDHEED